MTLIVGYTSSENTDDVEFINQENGGYLFGFESTRWYWQEEIFKNVSIKYLSRLAVDNLHIPESEFDELLNELKLIESLLKIEELRFWGKRFQNVRDVISFIRLTDKNLLLFIG